MAEKQYITEEWRPVFDEDFSEHFQVSSLGRVRSLSRAVPNTGRWHAWRQFPGKVMKPHLNKVSGYMQVRFNFGGYGRTFPVHRLVAIAFVPNPHGLPTVNHQDGVKTNNTATNLTWMSYSSNSNHAVDLGLMPVGERHGMSKLTVEEIVEIRRRYDSGETCTFIQKSYPTITLSQVWNIGKRVSWKCVEEDPSRPGVNPGHVRLTEDDVRAIRASYEACKALAARYGVSLASISRIRLGEAWRHVLPCPERSTPKKTRRRRGQPPDV